MNPPKNFLLFFVSTIFSIIILLIGAILKLEKRDLGEYLLAIGLVLQIISLIVGIYYLRSNNPPPKD